MLKDKRFIGFLLGVMIAAQIYVPASMIWSNEQVIDQGKLMKFRIAPIDPNDPFRGKFIVLDFEENFVHNRNGESYRSGESAYAVIFEDSLGYAFPYSLHKELPITEGLDYLQLTVVGSSKEGFWIEYPFNKFYMEESKAPLAEELYFEIIADTTHEIYALVYIKDGNAVLDDVQIDGVSIVDWIENPSE